MRTIAIVVLRKHFVAEAVMSDKDLLTEELIAINAVPNFLSGRVHVCTVRRWYSRGVRGHKLRTVFFGGRLYTSARFLREFFDAIGNSTAPRLDNSVATVPAAILAAEREFAQK